MKCTLNMFGWKGVTMKNHKKTLYYAYGNIKWHSIRFNLKMNGRCIETKGSFFCFCFLLYPHKMSIKECFCFSLKCCTCIHSTREKKTKSNHTLWQSIEKRGCYYFAHFYHLLNSMEKRKQRIWKESLHHGTVV